MKNKILSLFTIVLMSLLFSLAIVNADKSFTVTPNSVTENLTSGDTSNGVLTITNNGTEDINFTMSKSNFNSGGNSFTLNINSTSYDNLAPGNSFELEYSYDTSGEVAATYSGSVTIEDIDNSSLTSTIPFSVNLNAPSGALIEIDDESDDVFEMRGEIDERVDDTVRFRNNGNVSLNGISISVTDLEGDDYDIDRDEIDFDENNFDLEVGDSIRVEIEVDVPNGITEDTYVGTMTLESDEGAVFEFGLEIEVTADDLDVFVDRNDEEVRQGILEMVGESGDYVDDYDFRVENDGNVNLDDIIFEVEDDLEEEFSSNTIPASAVSFSPNSIDLEADEDDVVEVRVDIPSDQATGTYFADIKVISDSDRELDEFTLKVRVIGDVYIKEIEFDEGVSPDSTLEVDVVVVNQESRLQRNVKLTGTIFDVDTSNSDITDTTSSFLLDVREEKTQTLRFNIPEDARDGSKTLELLLEYDGGELTELEEIDIVRPISKLDVQSYSVNPSILTCEDRIFTTMKVKNIGRDIEDDVVISSEIRGFPIKAQTGSFEVEDDDVSQRNLVLDVSSLNPGTYTLVQKVSYSGLFEEEETLITINECSGGGIDIEPIEPDNSTGSVDNNQQNNETIELFGQELEKSTVYLSTGVAVVVVLILLSLFLL